MGQIQTKYNVDDAVYSAGVEYKEVWTTCPDCIGNKTWTITFGDGRKEECPCQTCHHFWEGSAGRLRHQEYVPSVRTLTIAKLEYHNEDTCYSCIETTTDGSRTMHYEQDLFSTYDEAKADADKRYEKQMAYLAECNFKKRGEFAKFTQTFGFCRADALKKERELKKWIELIKDSK